jgi:hypothetical protein
MASSSRDRISVDLRGLKAALIVRAQGKGVSPSDFVRSVLTTAVGSGCAESARDAAPTKAADERIRISLRMPRGDADALKRVAQSAGLTGGDLVSALVSRSPAIGTVEGPRALVAALTQSCDELAVLSRSLRHLTALLREGSIRAAQEYRAMLDGVDADIRAHLAVSSSVVAQLRPFIRNQRRCDPPPPT